MLNLNNNEYINKYDIIVCLSLLEVTKLLQFIAQASHELIPPDILEPILKTLANNFITERNSADVMAIGYVYYVYVRVY